MGLLKTPESENDKLLLASNEALKDTSPFKDLMATMEKPADLTAHPGTASAASAFHQYHNIISPPKSADCVSKKTTFFQVNSYSVSKQVSEAQKSLRAKPATFYQNPYFCSKKLRLSIFFIAVISKFLLLCNFSYVVVYLVNGIKIAQK